MTRIAVDFLSRCFTPKETIALLLRREKPRSIQQRIVSLESAIAPRYLAWLKYENCMGANIYVGANPLRPGSRRRTKEYIASVRHLYLDIDHDGDTRLAALQASEAVPTPTAVLSTSPGKYQVLWQVDGFNFELQEQTLKLLTIAFGGDSACTDCNRVLRVPGLLNQKYDPAYRVTVEYPSDSIASPDDFRLDLAAVDPMSSGHAISPRKNPVKHSHSETDWAWVSMRLAQGVNALELTLELASRRCDKPNPLYYAQRTVDVASARIWINDGVPIEEVITMLQSRRQPGLPASICSARAREIAQTAQRMIARKKSA